MVRNVNLRGSRAGREARAASRGRDRGDGVPSNSVVSTTVQRRADGSKIITKTYSSGRTTTTYKDESGRQVSALPQPKRLTMVNRLTGERVEVPSAVMGGGPIPVVEKPAVITVDEPEPSKSYYKPYVPLKKMPSAGPVRETEAKPMFGPSVLVERYSRPATYEEILQATKERTIKEARAKEKELQRQRALKMPRRKEEVVRPGVVKVTVVDPMTGASTTHEERRITEGFLTVEGQKQRAQNVARVMELAGQSTVRSLSFGLVPQWRKGYEIQARGIKSRPIRRGVEMVAQHPAEAALVATGVAGLAKGAAAGIAARVGAGKVVAGRAATSPAAARAAHAAATKAMQKAAAPQAVKFIPRVGRFLTGGLAQTAAIGAGSQFLSEEVGAGIAPKEYRRIMAEQGRVFEEGTAAGFAAEREAVGKRMWWKQTLFELPGAPIGPFGLGRLAGSKADYEKGVREYYKAQGYSQKEIDTAVKAQLRERTSREIAEVIGFIGSSASVEKYGRGEVRRVFAARKAAGQVIPRERYGRELFKVGFKNILPAGMIEGGVQEALQQRSEGRRIDYKDIGFMTGVGGLTAGVLGGAILATAGRKGVQKLMQTTAKGTVKQVSVRGAGRPVLHNILKGFAYVTDPFEKPGDVVADIWEGGMKRLGKRIDVPVIVPTPAETFLYGIFTEGKGKKGRDGPTPKPNGKKGPSISAFTFEYTPTPTTTPTPTVSMPTQPPTPPVTPPTPPPTVPEPTIPGFTPPTTPQTPPTTPETPPQTPPQVPVTTPASIITGVPTFTPIMRVPPPVVLPPLGFPAGSGFGGGAGKRPKYVNELAAGMALLGSMLGGRTGAGMQAQAAPFMKAPPKKKKKKAGVPMPPMIEFEFPILFEESKKKKGKKKKGGGNLLPFRIL